MAFYMSNQLNKDKNHDDFVNIFDAFRHGKKYIIYGLILSIVASIIYSLNSTPKYQVEMYLIPAPVNNSSDFSGIGAIGGLASIAGIDINSSGPLSPFDLFRSIMSGGDVAKAISDEKILSEAFPEKWDSEKNKWKGGHDVTYKIKYHLSKIGLVTLDDGNPDWRHLRDYLKDNIKTKKGVDNPVFTVSLRHENPVFASALLKKMLVSANDQVRKRDQNRSLINIKYLSQRLATETRFEHRQALAAAISAQERTLMFTESGNPYAAEMIDNIYVSGKPVSPNFLLNLTVFLIVGTSLSIALCFSSYYRAKVKDNDN
ncbi:Wzz/FepE/Etk N-terminal domain-containing protein [Sandaracinobacteroides sp. A072]|uniref:Wzz/FepE/Etk N-terminal domain-containing protein n=1 Tax=Sandaracinobacteroides sp. A072 TaxID=3461146 RepID=UPI004041E124